MVRDQIDCKRLKPLVCGKEQRVIGQAAIEIYIKQATSSLRQAIPDSLEGVEVKIVETGEIQAY
jgi:hypothetical protein